MVGVQVPVVPGELFAELIYVPAFQGSGDPFASLTFSVTALNTTNYPITSDEVLIVFVVEDLNDPPFVYDQTGELLEDDEWLITLVVTIVYFGRVLLFFACLCCFSWFGGIPSVLHV